jgi:hypothetical protein
MNTPTINGIKLLKKGVKDTDGTYSPVRYSIGTYFESEGRNIDTTRTYKAAAIRAKGYDSLPAALFPQNQSDPTTDYFVKDRALFREGTPEFNTIATLLAA